MINKFDNIELPMISLYFLDKRGEFIDFNRKTTEVAISTKFFCLPRIGEKLRMNEKTIKELYTTELLKENYLSIKDFTDVFGINYRNTYDFEIIDIIHIAEEINVEIEIILKFPSDIKTKV